MAPSSALQFASPRRFQLSRPVAPSMSVVHPASDGEDDMDAQPGAINAMTSSPRAMTEGRFMAMSSSRRAGSHPAAIPGDTQTGSSGSVLSGGKSVSKELMSNASRL